MKKLLLVSFSFLLLSGCATYNAATDRNELIFISTSQEVGMGKSYHEQIAKSEKVISAGPEYERLNHIGQRVARISDRQDYPYHFFLIDKDDINAFTVPGGYIYFYTGLFRNLPNDDAIAAVLAHEIGHCAAKHVVKKFQAAQSYNWARNIFMDILSTKVPEATTARTIASLGADGIVSLAMTAYSRQDELEADRLGIKYLHLARYDINAMITVFEVLQAKSPKDSTPLLLRSHPLTKTRIDAAKVEINKIKPNI